MSGSGPVGIGIIGAGVISDTYIENLSSFPDTAVLAIGDLRPDAARAKAAEHGIAAAGDVDVVLGHPDVEIVVNLTIPAAHAEVAERALAAGRHVWNEKPLALDRAAGRAVLDLADAAGLRVGCAPDTFLGTGLQTARRLIEAEAIGAPLTALALLQSPGPDSWHPNPALGPIGSVAAVASKARERRVIGSGPKAGESFEVTMPSHVGALIRFAGGQSAQVVFSFDSALARILLEVTGRDATMILPDPNEFDGDVGIRRRGSAATELLARTKARATRGTGVLDMARAIRADRPHRADGALAFHVLDVMVAIGEAAESGAFVSVESTVGVAELLPDDWDPHAATV